jgi:hypothetical protein
MFTSLSHMCKTFDALFTSSWRIYAPMLLRTRHPATEVVNVRDRDFIMGGPSSF